MEEVLIVLTNGAELPTYATPGSSGMDLKSVSEVVIPPNSRAKIPTGISLQLPLGLEAQVRPRSGLAANYGITVLNSPGTIDSDYRGEIQVILYNTSTIPFEVTHGMKIAQLVIQPVIQVDLIQGDILDSTLRGSGGFGSTGL